MYKRAISILLCLTLLISILPMDAFANDSQASEESGGDTSRTDDNIGGGGDGKRELVDERDAYSKTFVNDQGQLTKEIYAEPIHYKKSGKWQTISDDLVNDSGSEALETDATQLQAKFPKRMKDKFQKNQGITYGSGDNALNITSLKAVNDTGTLLPNTSSKVENKKNQILYQNIFPSMDLRHISFNKEVKEDWILHKYEGIHQFEYEINTKLTPHLNDNGSIGFYKDSQLQHKVFEMPKPVMEDSNYNAGLGSGFKSTQLHYTLTKVGDQNYQVSLDADKDWLTSPDRVYPIYIDPSVTIDILGDTFISSAYPTTNYNKEWDSSQGEYVLKVGKYDSTTGTNYAFMKFEIVGDLKGSVIDSADLKAYVTHSYYVSQKTGIWIDRVTSAPWYVNELTWNNRPSSTNITSTSVARDQWADFNVKSAVQGMVDGDYPNYGFKIHENGNGQTYWKKITAAESTNKAKLVISYHYPTMKNPTVSATQYGEGDTTGYVNVSWPSVTGASSYDLQMFDGKGFETVYSGTATSWTSKSKKIFPKSPYSSSSTYKVDGTGVELAVDPSPFYSAKNGASTTRKEYGFRVIAKYASGNSPPSSEVKKAIPADLVETPDRPDVNSSAYSETDATNKGRGWLDISWDAVPNATGYKVLIYNGKKYEEYSVGNVTKWSTKGQNIWPTDSEIAAGKYALHSDKKGAELPIDPNPVYKNSAADGGDYASFHRYSIRIKAVSELGTTPYSDSQYGYIPLETPKNVSGSGELVDPVSNKGALTIKWDAVSGAGGYKVELFDGKAYKSFDVGKVTSWNTSGQTLFKDVKDLPADPTQAYQENGAAQSFIDKKAYQFRVKAYRYNDETAPSSEQEKMSGERGLSGPSSTAYSSIPMREDLLGLEDYFTYGTHEMGNADVSVNVTAGNMVMKVTDQSLFTRGPLDFDLTRTYNSRSNRPSAFGNGWTFAGNESLTKKDTGDNATLYYEDEDGTRHEFDYDISKNAYVSPKGKYLTLTKETVNGAAGYRLKDTDGFSKLFEQDPSDAATYRLSAYQDANKNRILFKHTGDQLTEIAEVDDSGNTVRNSIKLSYTDGLITAVTFKDRSINYQYDNHQLVKTTIKASGTSKTLTNSFDYDEDGQMSEYTDSKGNVDTISYDDHQLTLLEPQKSGAESVSTTYSYDDKNNTFEASDTSGRTTTYKRDKDHNTYAVIETENADGTTSKVIEDANYNVLSETDENGKTATHTYDGRGNVLSDTDKEGKTTTYRYDDQNHVIEKVDPDGTKTTNQYSGDNLTRSQIGEEVTQYEYDAYGRQTKVIYPNGTYSTTAYQDSDLKEVEKDAKGNTTSTTYNDYGQTISETDADGRTTSETYDPLNPEIKTSVTDGNGHKTSYVYDDNGNLTSLTNASGKTKTFTYNGNDQLLTTEFPVSGQTTMKTTNTYDDNGNLSKVTENSGIVEQYSYDDVDQLIKAVIQKNGQNVLGWINTYDDAGQVTGRTLTDLTTNTPLVQKKWAYTADNQLATFTQGNYQSASTYDENDQLSEQKFSFADSSQPFDLKQSFSYTPEGKIKSASAAETGGSSLLSLAYTYDLKQNKSAIDYGSGLFKNQLAYDDANNLTSLSYTKGSDSTPALSFTYAYDHSGNITKETSAAGDTSYTYDGNNQLTKEVLPGGTTNSYEYDAAGNRTSAKLNGKTNTYTYNDANQVVTKNGTAFKYDADGNLIQDDQYKYEYNALGAQTRVSKLDGTEVARYEYDENGLRTKKIIGDQTIEYAYDGDANNLVLEVTKKNSQIQTYRYFQWDDSGKPVGMVIKEKNGSGAWQTKPYYFWTNQRGDVTAIVDSSGTQVGSYTYDAFGNERSETGDIAKSNPIRYAGYYYDTETKHDYLKARYYDPQNGNFLALDPHPGDDDDPVSQNGYTYAGNNPVMEIDPDGDFAWFLAAVPAIGMALLLTTTLYITYRGVLWLAKKSSEYKDVTKSRSTVRNRRTDVTKKGFDRALRSNGWKRVKKGKVTIYTKKGAKYVVRDNAKSTGGPTADFYPKGSKRIKLKIRLKR